MESTSFGQKIVLMKEGKILILKRSNRKNEGEVWDLPGGAVEFGEDCYLSIQRECLEETKIELNSFKPLKILSGKGEPICQWILVLYYSDDFFGNLALSQEHIDFKWIEPKDLDNYELYDSIKLIKEEISNL